MEASTSTSLVFPPLWKRFGAYVIDLYFIFMLAYVLIVILPESIADKLRLVIFALALLYEPICNTTLGYTFGAFIFKFRVKDAANPAQKLPFRRALIRFVVKVVLGWISFLTIHSDTMRRAIHDRVANSVVIAK
ncbi:RDD family protein [Larkinella arboricola]|uniref:RDD family protein n=1 Tax=Larkinella arboricola TaxID=643671 RepID=UPI000DB9A2C6|nr:RDD family protein [Larkinella arboricola]